MNTKQKNTKILLISLLSLITIAMVLFFIFRNGDTYRIEGKLKGGENKYLVLLDISGENPKAVDTIFLSSKGKFSKKEELKESSIFLLQSDKDFIMICPSKSEKIKIQGEYQNFSSTYKIKGSKESEKLYVLAERQIEIGKLLKEIQSEYDNASEDQKPLLIKEYRLRFRKVAQEEYKFVKQFITENKGSLVTLPAVYTEVIGQPLFSLPEDEPTYRQVLEGLEKTFPNNPHTIKFRKFMNNFDKSKQITPQQ